MGVVNFGAQGSEGGSERDTYLLEYGNTSVVCQRLVIVRDRGEKITFHDISKHRRAADETLG